MSLTEGLIIMTRDDLYRYLERYRADMMRGFAQFVIAEGHGATAPLKYDHDGQPKPPETWQQVGRRLYGPEFSKVLRTELAKLSAGNAGPESDPAEWSGLDAGASLEQATLDF